MPFAFIDIIDQFDGRDAPWPGTQKFVTIWWVLANGKAVGWNKNSKRGWTFPVIPYQESKREPMQNIVIRFRNPLHEKFHQTLLNSGFSFQLSSDHMVGLEYQHPKKKVGVVLTPVAEDTDGTPVDDTLEYGCTNPDEEKVYDKADYNRLEWTWINEAMSENLALERELHILINVRPSYMFSRPVEKQVSQGA